MLWIHFYFNINILDYDKQTSGHLVLIALKTNRKNTPPKNQPFIVIKPELLQLKIYHVI